MHDVTKAQLQIRFGQHGKVRTIMLEAKNVLQAHWNRLVDACAMLEDLLESNNAILKPDLEFIVDSVVASLALEPAL